MLNRIRKETKTAIYNEQPVSNTKRAAFISSNKINSKYDFISAVFNSLNGDLYRKQLVLRMGKILSLAHHWFVKLKNIIEVELPFRQGFGFYFIKSPFFHLFFA